NEAFDFKGKLLHSTRQLSAGYREALVDWPENEAAIGLEPEIFTLRTEYDALGRMTRLYNWHRGEGARVAVYEPRYNDRGLLAREARVAGGRRRARTAAPVRRGSARRGAQRTAAIRAVRYDAKGQRTRIHFGNGTTTTYEYDSETFRLERIHTVR